jgi:hypothetical protein
VHQLSLFDQQTEKERKLLDALDDLRKKYGKGAVQRAGRMYRKSERD